MTQPLRSKGHVFVGSKCFLALLSSLSMLPSALNMFIGADVILCSLMTSFLDTTPFHPQKNNSKGFFFPHGPLTYFLMLHCSSSWSSHHFPIVPHHFPLVFIVFLSSPTSSWRSDHCVNLDETSPEPKKRLSWTKNLPWMLYSRCHVRQ